jgi:MFS family permease
MKDSSGFLLGLLGIAFIVLKLTGHIDWSWWWVTAPFWIGIVFTLVVIVIWFSIGIYNKLKK